MIRILRTVSFITYLIPVSGNIVLGIGRMASRYQNCHSYENKDQYGEYCSELHFIVHERNYPDICL
jgi:hypothetical protein